MIIMTNDNKIFKYSIIGDLSKFVNSFSESDDSSQIGFNQERYVSAL